MPLKVLVPQSTTILQLGPCVEGEPRAASGVLASPRSGRGPELRPETWARFSSSRVWSLPQVQESGWPPSWVLSVDNAAWKAVVIAWFSEPPGEGWHLTPSGQPSPQALGGHDVWPARAQASRSCPSASSSSCLSTGTFFAFHHGSNDCDRYDCQKVDQIEAAAEPVSIRKSQLASRSRACCSDVVS